MGALSDALVSRGGYNRTDADNAERGPRASELAREFLGIGATPQAQAPTPQAPAPSTNQLAQVLVQRGGYNPVDAANAATGPRASELAREFLGGQASGQPSIAGQQTLAGQSSISGGGGLNVLETAKQLLGFQQQANQPVIQSLQQQAGEVGQSFAGQRQRLESGIQPLRDRYNQILEQMKGRVSTDLSREYGRRGIPLSSGMFETNLTERINPITRDIGLSSEEGVRGIQDLIASLTGQETEQKRSITNAIAQLQAGEPSGAITQALSLLGQQQQTSQSAAEQAWKERVYRETTLPESQYAIKKPYYQPKSAVAGGGGISDLFKQLGFGQTTEPKPTAPPSSFRPQSRIYGYSGLT